MVVINSTVIGIDTRYAFAIPIYGCGRLHEIDNQYARALHDDELFQKVWDPLLRIDAATMPTLWHSWPREKHFALDSQAATYRAAPGVRMVSLVPDMGHSQPAAWNRDESFEFADSIVKTGEPWCQQVGAELDGTKVAITFNCSRPLNAASLHTNTGTGHTGERTWAESPAQLTRIDEMNWLARATLPPETSGWFVNVHAAGKNKAVVVSSDYEVVGTD